MYKKVNFHYIKYRQRLNTHNGHTQQHSQTLAKEPGDQSTGRCLVTPGFSFVALSSLATEPSQYRTRSWIKNGYSFGHSNTTSKIKTRRNIAFEEVANLRMRLFYYCRIILDGFRLKN